MNTIQNGTELMAAMIEFAKSRHAQKKHKALISTLIIAIAFSIANLV
jgi:hypothetical protein